MMGPGNGGDGRAALGPGRSTFQRISDHRVFR